MMPEPRPEEWESVYGGKRDGQTWPRHSCCTPVFAGGEMVLLVAHQCFGQDIFLVDGHKVV